MIAVAVTEDERIDLAIVTHADYDHIRGMIDVFEDYEVGEFWYTGYESRELADATSVVVTSTTQLGFGRPLSTRSRTRDGSDCSS